MANLVLFCKFAIELFALLRELFAHAKKVSPDDPAKFIRDARESFAGFRAATDSAAKDEALKKITDTIDSL